MSTCAIGGLRAPEAYLPAPAFSLRTALERLLERALRRHPVIACAGTLLLTGAGMVLAVGVSTCAVVLPLSILLGLV